MLEYVKYTKRIAILEEFFPTENEQKLYDMVSDYLARPTLYALPNSQRQLMTLILRKLLASSTYAIYGTFCSLISRLEKLIQDQGSFALEEIGEDYEADEEWLDDEEVETEDDAQELHPTDIDGIKKEIADLVVFRDLAAKIKKNSKAEHLFVALEKGFDQLQQLGAPKKALIFTESRRTSSYMSSWRNVATKVSWSASTAPTPTNNPRPSTTNGSRNTKARPRSPVPLPLTVVPPSWTIFGMRPPL